MNSPKVSVIMPVHNSERYVGKSIRSVLNQSYHNIELIIINDYSTDHSSGIIQSFLYDDRIIYCKFNNNRGVAAARNKGLELASGKYISFLDSDDVWLKNKVKDQLLFMLHNKIEFSYCYYEMVHEDGSFIKIVNELPSLTSRKNIILSNSIPMLTVMIKSNLLNKCKFPDIHHEDYALWLNLFRRKTHLKAYLFREIVAKYCVHNNSISDNKLKSCIWVWHLYRNQMHFSVIKSLICFSMYAINGISKHYYLIKLRKWR